MKREELKLKISGGYRQRIVVSRSTVKAKSWRSSRLERRVVEGENPVCGVRTCRRGVFHESGCLGMQPKMGGKLLLKLNIGTRPIANKYREGKMKSTLKRKLRVRETVSREAHGISNARQRFRWIESVVVSLCRSEGLPRDARPSNHRTSLACASTSVRTG